MDSSSNIYKFNCNKYANSVFFTLKSLYLLPLSFLMRCCFSGRNYEVKTFGFRLEPIDLMKVATKMSPHNWASLDFL